jgi:DNA polymerase-4
MSHVILHLDMDAFYASVEQRDNPALKGKPLIVGAPPDQRGVVCAASYEARKFGVRSAMPSSIAKRLCPAGIFIFPRMEHYRAESAEIMRIVDSCGGLVEQVSIDEAYIDLSARCEANAPDENLRQALPIARQLKAQILAERKLTASIGIAANKFLAKLGSDFNKPDGLTMVPESEKVAFLRTLPVRAIHGVGKVTEQILKGAGLETIAQLQDYRGDLRALVGSFGPVLKQFAFGEDDRPVDDSDVIKSISSESTFLQDTDERKTLRLCLWEQAREIADKLARKRIKAQTVQVKVRYSDFTTLTRQLTLEEPVVEATDIYRLGCHLLRRDRLVSRPLRLIGLGVSGFTEPGCEQMVLALDDPRRL